MRWPFSRVVRFGGLVLLPLLIVLGTDPGGIADSLAGSRPGFIGLAMGITLVSILLRAWRWQVLARACGVVYGRFRDYLFILYGGLFAGAALPQSIAPFSQLVFLTEDGHPPARATASILVDRVVEVVVTVLVGALAAAYFLPRSPVVAGLVMGASLGSVGALAAVYALRRPLARFSQRQLAPRFPRWQRLLERLRVGEVMASWSGFGRGEVALALVLSLAIAVSQMAIAWALAEALGLGLSVAFVAASWSLAAMTLFLPITFNGLGTREGVLVLTFSSIGAPREEAVALGLLIFGTGLLSRLPGILPWAWRPRRARLIPSSEAGYSQEPKGQAAPMA